MDLTLTITHIRSNINVGFYQQPEAFLAYRRINYINTGKLTQPSISYPDDLTAVYIFIFTDDAAKTEYLNDPTIQAGQAARAEYNTANGIETQIVWS